MIELFAAAALLSAQETTSLDLHLQCDGIATFPESQSTTASAWGSSGGYASGAATTVRRGSAPDRVLVALAGEDGRVRLPRSMVPTVNGGGEDGWWPLNELEVTDSQITGRFRLNPFNRPSVRIDRITGSIEIQGSFKLSFRGDCVPIDATQRRF